MTGLSLENHLTNELKYQFRKRVAEECRKQCPDDDPMITGITVMIGSVLAMAVFSTMPKGGSGRGR